MQNIDSEIVKSPKASAFTLIVAFVCVALVGLALIPLLPVKLNPSRTLPGFTVRFSMPGTSARVVEMTATSKLEAMLARVKGIRGISSTSGNGWGSVGAGGWGDALSHSRHPGIPPVCYPLLQRR